VLVDAVIFDDELDILDFRLKYLADKVDYFLIAESKRTFAGEAKPLVFRSVCHRYAHLTHRLKLVEYELPAEAEDRWEREALARNSLLPALRAFPPESVALVCDVDEIPSAEQCVAARTVDRAHSIAMRTYLRRANWRVHYEQPWLGARAVPVSRLPEKLETLRWGEPLELPVLGGSDGAHLSYVGFNASGIARKYSHYSHVELDTPAAASHSLIALADRMAVDHMGKPYRRGRGLLSVEDADDWDDIQEWAHRDHPDWFDSRQQHPRRLARLCAVMLIDEVVSLGFPDSIEVLSGRRIAPSFLVFLRVVTKVGRANLYEFCASLPDRFVRHFGNARSRGVESCARLLLAAARIARPFS